MSLFGADFGPANGHLYRAMLNEFLFTKIEEEDIGNICFHQEGATCHTAEATVDVLRPVFENRNISRRADIVWPPWRFGIVGLLFVRCRQRQVLCRQARDN